MIRVIKFRIDTNINSRTSISVIFVFTYSGSWNSSMSNFNDKYANKVTLEFKIFSRFHKISRSSYKNSVIIY